MELRKGFIHTDIGILPEYWEIEPVKTVADVRTGPFGSALHESDYVSDGTPIITVEHLGERGIEHINLPLVSDSDKRRLSSYMLVENDIVFSRVGSVDRNSLVRKSEIGWLFSGRLLRLRIRNKRISPSFVSHYFHSEDFKNRIRNVAVGQTMASLNTQILNDIQIAFPPYPEQKAIAEVLSDVDALIASLEALIAKKRAIKQGVMQELLTGKTRLPEFNRQWEVKTLRNILKIPVTDGPHLTPKFIESGVPFLSVNNIVNNKIDLTDLRYISKEDDEIFSKKCKPQKHDLLMGKAASVGKIAINCLDIDFNIWSPIALIRVNDENDPFFIYYSFQSKEINKQIAILTNSSSQGNIGMGDVEKIVFRLPSISEQTAISQIFCDIDDEICLLEEQRLKLNALKQGMMQELLTGRIRLKGGYQ